MEALGAKHGKPIYWPALRKALLQADKQQMLSVDTAAVLTSTTGERATIPVRSRQVTALDTDAFIDIKVADVWQRGAPKLRELKSAIEYARGVSVPADVFVHAARQAATKERLPCPKRRAPVLMMLRLNCARSRVKRASPPRPS